MENKSSTCHMTSEQRLIDANERIKLLEDNTTEEEWLVNQYNADWIYSMLEHAPTVDAVEVVHGEWLVEAYTADDSIVVIPYRKHQHNDPFCSRCGHYALLNCGEYVTSNYCPNCGAKMDGGNEDD